MLTHGLPSKTARCAAPQEPAILIARTHILGLALIAMIAMGTHYVMDRLLVAERGKAAVLELAGDEHAHGTHQGAGAAVDARRSR